MRAIVLDKTTFGGHRFGRRPNPAADEVLVRVTRAGVCETDLQLIKGYMGFRGVLGHEFVGVAESGPYAGQRVVGEINCACWHCDTCRSGLPTHCPNRTVLGILNHDGAFADLIAVPQRNLHRVPDSIPDDIAVFTEPVAAAFQIPAQLDDRRAPTASSSSATAGSAICARRCWRRSPMTCWSSASIARSWRCSRRWDCGRRCCRTTFRHAPPTSSSTAPARSPGCRRR